MKVANIFRKMMLDGIQRPIRRNFLGARRLPRRLEASVEAATPLQRYLAQVRIQRATYYFAKDFWGFVLLGGTAGCLFQQARLYRLCGVRPYS